MKRLVCTIIALFILTTTVYAGEWQQDADGWRYKNDDETYKTGWHQDVDGKWYYLNDGTTYMETSTTTIDGYTVGADGAWDGNGKEAVAPASQEYDKSGEFVVSAYLNGSDTVGLGYEYPAAVSYNSVKTNDSGTIYIKGIVISEGGAMSVNYGLDNMSGWSMTLIVTEKYNLADGTSYEETRSLNLARSKGSVDLLANVQGAVDAGTRIVSAEVYINSK